ncbi:MAG TPA: ThuA domain-containing protein [Vicinamibacteria bacterium]|nr:ThuA domain-containing protein [Vicinamibacteria bacterium]
MTEPGNRFRAGRLAALAVVLCGAFAGAATEKPSAGFRVVAFYADKVEQAHLSFAREADGWFGEMARGDGFRYEATTDWTRLEPGLLSRCDVVLFLDARPEVPAQREAFRRYMEGGGGWMGFHFAGFALTPSDFPQDWDWYHDEFLGSGSYRSNTWRPTSAVLRVEAPQHPALRGLPATFTAAPNEWYRWQKDLRQNPAIEILLAIDPSSFPLGTGPKPHEIWHDGYYPVVWTHRGYHMAYVNMGHDDLGDDGRPVSSSFSSATQNHLMRQLLYWVAGREAPR